MRKAWRLNTVTFRTTVYEAPEGSDEDFEHPVWIEATVLPGGKGSYWEPPTPAEVDWLEIRVEFPSGAVEMDEEQFKARFGEDELDKIRDEAEQFAAELRNGEWR